MELTNTIASSLPATTTPQGSPALNREEIERIVRRVEQHFSGELEAAQHRIHDLEAEVATLKKRVALPVADSDGTVEELKRQLLQEKRARLACEEQSQLISEEHAKLVQTLEQRIKKQDKVIQEAGTPMRGTPRSARLSTRLAEPAVRPPQDAQLFDLSKQDVPPLKGFSPPRVASVPPPALSADAVSDFLSAIGEELDAINSIESNRAVHLKGML